MPNFSHVAFSALNHPDEDCLITMGHKSSEAGSDSEYSERQLTTKTRRNKKNSNKMSPDGGLQFDDRRNRNNSRIIPEVGQVEMEYPQNKNSVENSTGNYGGRKAEKADQGKQTENSDHADARKLPVRAAALLMDLCCDGCTKKISRTVTNFAGCDLVSIDKQGKTVTVKGTTNVIRALADLLRRKFKKSVEIAPAEGDCGEERERVARGGDGATKADGKELDGNKSNRTPVTTAELKMAVPCACEGHLLQIRKSVAKTKGCHPCEISIDEMGKTVISLTGTMDVINAAKKKLEKKLRTSVEITPSPPILGDLDHGGRKQRKRKSAADGGGGQAKENVTH